MEGNPSGIEGKAMMLITPSQRAQHEAVEAARMRLGMAAEPVQRPVPAARVRPAPIEEFDPDSLPHTMPSWKRICIEVAKSSGQSFADIVGPRRGRALTDARFEVMYRLRAELGLTHAAIGRRLGGRDHTTISYGTARHASRLTAVAGQAK